VVATVLILEAVRTTPRTRLLRLGLPDAFAFRAGQAVMAGLAGSSSQSAYSIASAPSLASRGTLELLVPADGAFGEAGLDPCDAVGRSLTIDGPIGEFGVPPDAESAPLLLIGGGTGIAPLRSVALDRLERAGAPPMVLVYSARTPDEFAFGDEFAGLDREGRMRVHQTVTRDERAGEWPWRSGRIDDALLAAVLPGPEAWCLVCGPAGFVDTVTTTLVALGVRGPRIVVER
jgi:NAD(P)H-flavin reductase